jgi:hypothetical protein
VKEEVDRSELTHVEHRVSLRRIYLTLIPYFTPIANTAEIKQRRLTMVNESMSMEELTGRAYARGLSAVKVSSRYLAQLNNAN